MTTFYSVPFKYIPNNTVAAAVESSSNDGYDLFVAGFLFNRFRINRNKQGEVNSIDWLCKARCGGSVTITRGFDTGPSGCHRRRIQSIADESAASHVSSTSRQVYYVFRQDVL
jgi:hypothetical protein